MLSAQIVNYCSHIFTCQFAGLYVSVYAIKKHGGKVQNLFENFHTGYNQFYNINVINIIPRVTMGHFQMQQEITINSKYYLPNYKNPPPPFQKKIVSKTTTAALAAAAHIKSLCTIFQHKLPLFPFCTSILPCFTPTEHFSDKNCTYYSFLPALLTPYRSCK